MKEFLSVLRRFVWPYKRFVALSVVFNVLSALLNIFSFAALIPILQILFKTGDHVEVKELMAWGSGQNALYAYLSMPFIALFGLNVFSVRAVNLIFSLLTVIAVYSTLKQAVNKKTHLSV